MTVARGAVVDTARRDPAGVPWVQKPANLVNIEDGPLTFWIAADTPGVAYLTIILQGPPGTRMQAPGARQRKLGGNRHATCVAVAGPDAQRVATGTVTPEPPDMSPPTGGEFDPVPTPAKAVRLESVRASATPCAPGLRGLAL